MAIEDFRKSKNPIPESGVLSSVKKTLITPAASDLYSLVDFCVFGGVPLREVVAPKNVTSHVSVQFEVEAHLQTSCKF